MDIKKRIIELTKQINQANYDYHTLDQPKISDQSYDKLLKELVELENAYPEYQFEDHQLKKLWSYFIELSKSENSNSDDEFI